MPVSWNMQPAAITTSASCAAHPVVGRPWRARPRRAPSSRKSRSAMLSTIRTCTHEWSDMPEPLGVHLLHVPPAAQALVGVGGGKQLLEPAVPAQGSADLHLRQLHAGKGRRRPGSGTPWGCGRLSPSWTDTDARISDLRVSVTDRCNFRCQYCMPADGLPWLDREEILRFEEIERLVRVFAADGRDRRAAHRRRAARAGASSRACSGCSPRCPGSRTSRSPRTATCSSATPRRWWPPG